MYSDLGNLSDFFPQTEQKCRIRGCSNVVQVSGDRALKNVAAGKAARQARMCDECHALLQTLEDKELPCSKPGCQGTWIWNRYQQLEGIRTGHDNVPPRGYCEKCRAEMKGLESEQKPCRIKGCKNTWTLTPGEKFRLNGKRPAHRMCDECARLLATLQDREVSCRIHGCEHTWTWNRFQQLEHLRAGKSLDKPPHQMCAECLRIFFALEDQEIPCRIHGCKNTWTWAKFDQLTDVVAALKKQGPVVSGEEQPSLPAEKNPTSEMQDVAAETSSPAALPSAPCFCEEGKNTEPVAAAVDNQPDAAEKAETAAAEQKPVDSEEDRRRAEIRRSLPTVKTPSRMCRECFDFWSKAKDLEVPCRIHGCKNTWIWTKSMQLSQKQHGRTTPPPHLCEECTSKLESLKEELRPCMTPECTGTWIYPKEDQLRDLTMKREPKPRRCAACRDFLAKHTEKIIKCQGCGKDLMVSSVLQLQIHLGTAAEPTLCADCTGKKLNEVFSAPAAQTTLPSAAAEQNADAKTQTQE